MDPDDGLAYYQWVQIGKPAVNLLDLNAKQCTFTAPDVAPKGLIV